jgi:hypothetical protein
MSCAPSHGFCLSICAPCVSSSTAFYTFSDPIRNRRKLMSKHGRVERHPDLFEGNSPQIAMPRDQKKDLVRFIGILLIEIVRPTFPMMTTQDGDDDKDYA